MGYTKYLRKMKIREQEMKNTGGQMLAGAGRAGVHKDKKSYKRQDFKQGRYDRSEE